MSSISSLFPNALPPAANASSNAAAAQPAQTVANVATDTVQLTEAQQVYQLFNQGQSVSQISSSLGLSVASVNGYLNISNG
jgi:DNA-binding CsgD family transcriptional regulator